MINIVDYTNLPSNFFDYKELANIDVASIINDVKVNGDEAVRNYCEKFGDGRIENFEVTKDEIEKAFQNIPQKTVDSINFAINNVKTFAQHQLNSIKEFEIKNEGVLLGQKIIPLERIGAYVPGGNYPLPSSAIMSCVPAKVAGVKEVFVFSPKIKDVTIAAAVLAGADKIFKIGGIQAIAAMAYGTQTIPKVDKITGPGNKYVTAAKKYVYGGTGIDFLAGPSEVMIIGDETVNPDFVAADMLAQCEHDICASSIFITTSKKNIDDVKNSLQKQLEALQTKEIARKALENSYIIYVDNLDKAVEIANKKAPEHLEIVTKNNDKLINDLKNYGSLFIGTFSAESIGDYCSGTNHILPTNGVARYSGGLSVFDFIKIVTYQNADKNECKNLLRNASFLAETEGLAAHKNACDIRLQEL